MRKQIFVTALLVINGLMLNAQQQWSGSTDGSGLIYRDGNVVVGGTSLLGTYGSTERIIQIQGTASWLSFGNTSVTSSLNIGFSPGFGVAGIYANQLPLTFSTNYAERLRINTDGSIGIGTTTPSPSDKLTIAGSTRVISGANFNLQASTSVPNDAGDIVFLNSSGTEMSRIYSDPTGSGGLSFSVTTSTFPKMMLMSNGNLLLGKTSQANTSYMLDVNGNVRANKIVVNTTGADFVFDSSYKLMTLNNLDSFIRHNHHLPEIKPASEMKENGVDLGDNQIRLLQKVEELTLYTIDQNKKLEQQQSLLQQQQSVIESLQAQLNELKKKIK